jgi:hypothetical protein
LAQNYYFQPNKFAISFQSLVDYIASLLRKSLVVNRYS